MRIMVLGIRGIPNVQGGVETHSEQLYPRLAALGCNVDVLVRTAHVRKGQRSFGSIRLHRLWSTAIPGFESIIHSLLGVGYAAFARPDVLHIHAIGPAIVAPLARLFGLRVVVTHHGPDYEREKWDWFARAVLRIGECFGAKMANGLIAISDVIAKRVRNQWQRESYLIPNGVVPPQLRTDDAHVRAHGLEPHRYFLLVSRMVPEKRHLDLIEAFARANVPGWKLALVGRLDTGDYSRAVAEAAAATPGVVTTGFQSGEGLYQLYSHAGAFILPSSHEGLPIALLEALSYGLPVAASDIPAHLELNLDKNCYFHLGDTAALAQRLERLAAAPFDRESRAAVGRRTIQKYDWDRIARQTLEVYQEVIEGRAKARIASRANNS